VKKGEKLKADKPKQYEQGWTEFYKLKFFLTPDSLIPRPETELLVDEVIKLSKEIKEKAGKVPTIIDMGTGSGNIAIALAKNLDEVGIVATEISPEALEIAKKNARFHKVETDKIVFIVNDLYEKFTVAPDIIVTNLPYIPTARLLYIDPMVTDWEPRVALDGGEDGFALYRKLFSQIADKKLFPKYIIGEIDYTHADIVLQESRKYFPQAQAEVKHDLAKKQRYFVISF
jgi:release factor glutamine methyltransferase